MLREVDHDDRGARRIEVRREDSLNAGCSMGCLVGLDTEDVDHHCIGFGHVRIADNLVDLEWSTGCMPGTDVVCAGPAPVPDTDTISNFARASRSFEDTSSTDAGCTAVRLRNPDAVPVPVRPARVHSKVQLVRLLQPPAVCALAEHSSSLHDWHAGARGYRFRPWCVRGCGCSRSSMEDQFKYRRLRCRPRNLSHSKLARSVLGYLFLVSLAIITSHYYIPQPAPRKLR